MKTGKPLHILIPLHEFMTLLGIDPRETALAEYLVITATYTIEEYCRRRILKKSHTEYLPYYGDRIFPLQEYPVRSIKQVYCRQGPARLPDTPIHPEDYSCRPAGAQAGDLPALLTLGPHIPLIRGARSMEVHYTAGYTLDAVPPDLANACLELAAWNLARHRSKRIGMTGPVRGTGTSADHLETSMPENVRLILEPYKRKTL